MLPSGPRAVLRQIPHTRALQTRRPLSTAPPHKKSRSLRSTAVRWGIVAGGLYYYNTSSVLAEEPPFSPSLAHPTTPEETSYPTLDSIKPTRRPKSPPDTPETASPTSIADSASGAFDNPRPAGLEETEQEASQEGAFNEETGEINWDCPCLGGMAHGPCGEQFREAFSCFVYSKEEPKGMDCIDKFKGMQDCFREHPEEYDDQLANPEPPEDDEEPGLGDAVDSAIEGIAGDAPVATLPTSASTLAQPSEPEPEPRLSHSEKAPSPTPSSMGVGDDSVQTGRAKDATEQIKRDHETGGEEQLVPKEWHDTRQKNNVQ